MSERADNTGNSGTPEPNAADVELQALHELLNGLEVPRVVADQEARVLTAAERAQLLVDHFHRQYHTLDRGIASLANAIDTAYALLSADVVSFGKIKKAAAILLVAELDAPIVRVAESQPQYEPVDTARVAHPQYPTVRTIVESKVREWNAVVMAFRPTLEELALLNAGEDVYIGLLTFGRPQQPINVIVGKRDAAAAYQVKPT